MSNLTIKDALLKTAQATKKYVDDNIFSGDYNDLENKPFYTTEPQEVSIMDTFTIATSDLYGGSGDGHYWTAMETNESLVEGVEYIAVVNDTRYNCTAIAQNGIVGIGNASLSIDGAEDTGECFYYDGSYLDIRKDESTAESYTIDLYTIRPVYIQIDEKYLENKPGLKTYENTYTINNEEVIAGLGAEIFNDYEKNIATGKWSHAEGRSTTATGISSHAEGNYTKALGNYSHAEGGNTEATELWSHAEGNTTKATGTGAHAEGDQTLAEGSCSHAEGYKTTAGQICAHAEGRSNQLVIHALSDYSYNTTKDEVLTAWENTNWKFLVAHGRNSHAEGEDNLALDDGSHAEGNRTVAYGKHSHAEGINTIAKSDNQHVQGKFNIEDAANTYAHIVGNGTADNARSNAHTLDWDGNAWYAGQVIGTNLPYIDGVETSVIFSDNEITQDSGSSEIIQFGYLPFSDNKCSHKFQVGKQFKIKINDNEYVTCECKEYIPDNDIIPQHYYLGNYSLVASYWRDYVSINGQQIPAPDLGDTGETFCILISIPDGRVNIAIPSITDAFSLEIAAEVDNYVQLDRNFIQEVPGKIMEAYSLIKYPTFDEDSGELVEVEVQIGDGAEIFNEYNLNIAVGDHSHAEGFSTKALGGKSHAEGADTIASGEWSHAEGGETEASGECSHAEGNNTVASGESSHAEGSWNTASGWCSHAEGTSSTASGDYSHVEGYENIATGNYQHVQGKWNIEDANDTYAHIVGNGEYDARSNAHTLDWEGNAWYAGNVSIGTDNKELATKVYVDDEIVRNKYSHPSAHPASIITTTDDRQFASAQEKEQWNAGYNHSQASHAPTNAQKNSDITKAEIEAKLTGTITTHTHDVNSEGSKLATESFVEAEIAQAMLEGEVDVSVFALKEDVPTKVSQLENDMEFLPSLIGTYTKMEQYQVGNQNILPSDVIWQTGYLLPTGEISSYLNPSYIVTVSYIPVEELTTYAMFYDGASIQAVHYAFYNDNYEFISHSTSGVALIATPEDAAYFRTSILITNSAIGLTAGSQVIDENGKLIEPSGLFEMYQQSHTQYEAGEYFEREILSRENFYVPFDCLLDGSVRLANCEFTVEYPPINIFDPTQIKSGYNGDATGYGKFGSNEAYICTEPVSVSPGDHLTIWKLALNKLTAESKNARFISVYDKDYQLVECVTYLHEYTVPENGKHVMITLYLSDWDSNTNLMYIQRHESSVYMGYENPLEPVFKIDPNCVDNLVIEELPVHTCLPPEICIPAGMTIELYNAQCCLEADKYHIQWVGQYGAAYDWKYSIVGEEELVGTSFTLTMNVIDDALKVLKSEKTTVKIVSNVINTDQLIIPIGDSLTNQKPWLNNIHSVLSNGKVSFRGTRGTTDPTLINGITHEGRSGAGSGWYNLGTSTYSFDSNGLSTLSDVAANPFWNPTTDAFDFDYYCNSTADGGAGYFQNANGVGMSLDPTGIMIYLGANGVSLDPNTQVRNIRTLISGIRNSIKGASIPIYVVNTQFRAPYILSTTADGFNTNSSGEFKFQNDMKYQNLMRELNSQLKTVSNVFIVPIATTHDSAHNYPYTEVNVNPYNDKFVERKYTDTIHPMECGYLQMAATMYGSICAHYEEQ